MGHADRFRDSTQILLPAAAIEGIREDLEAKFTVSVRRESDRIRIIGSPDQIKAASEFLAMRGVSVA